MWDMRRSVDATVFPDKRITVRFEYPDAARGKRDWWLISDSGQIDLCLKDPGYETNLLIRCSLKVMTAVWICARTFTEALRSGDIVVSGSPELARNLPKWLRASALSRLGEAAGSPRLSWGAESVSEVREH